jgi:hypothetical protein
MPMGAFICVHNWIEAGFGSKIAATDPKFAKGIAKSGFWLGFALKGSLS